MANLVAVTLDDARAALPDCGFALYALDPAGEVTLEVHLVGGDILTFRGDTETEVLGYLFPPSDLYD